MELITRPSLPRALPVLLILARTASAHAATRYLTVINDDARAVIRIELAPAGTTTFEPLAAPYPLIGGRDGQATFALPDGPCLRQVRVVYRDSSTLTITAWNACHQTTLHIGAARQAGLRQHPPI